MIADKECYERGCACYDPRDGNGVQVVAKQEQGDKSPPEQWRERWYGSGSEKGWWIVCGKNRIAHLGVQVSSDEVSKVVDAHNRYKPTVQLKEQEQRSVSEHTGEPVAVRQSNGEIYVLGSALVPIGAYLYTTPQQRKPLTDEQIDKAWRSVDYTVPWEQHRIDIARAIEAAHGITASEAEDSARSKT